MKMTNKIAKIATYSALALGSIGTVGANTTSVFAGNNTPITHQTAKVHHTKQLSITQAPTSDNASFNITNAEVKLVNGTAAFVITIDNEQPLDNVDSTFQLIKGNTLVAGQKSTVKHMKSGAVTVALPLYQTLKSGKYSINVTLGNNNQVVPMTLSDAQVQKENVKIKDHLAQSQQQESKHKYIIGAWAFAIFMVLLAAGFFGYLKLAKISMKDVRKNLKEAKKAKKAKKRAKKKNKNKNNNIQI